MSDHDVLSVATQDLNHRLPVVGEVVANVLRLGYRIQGAWQLGAKLRRTSRTSQYGASAERPLTCSERGQLPSMQ